MHRQHTNQIQRTPEQVWKDYLVKLAQLRQLEATRQNLRALRCRVIVKAVRS